MRIGTGTGGFGMNGIGWDEVREVKGGEERR